jgi:hypothetical protein
MATGVVLILVLGVELSGKTRYYRELSGKTR